MLLERLQGVSAEIDTRVGELDEEHLRLAGQSKQLLRLVQAILEDHIVDKRDLLDVGRSYLAAQFDHMRFEEEVVFPLARRLLGDDELQDIDYHTVKYEEDPLFGEQTGEYFQHLYDAVSRIVDPPRRIE